MLVHMQNAEVKPHRGSVDQKPHCGSVLRRGIVAESPAELAALKLVEEEVAQEAECAFESEMARRMTVMEAQAKQEADAAPKSYIPQPKVEPVKAQPAPVTHEQMGQRDDPWSADEGGARSDGGLEESGLELDLDNKRFFV
jgi:hypothetical protein